tara:strand:+ start:1339 stop:1560 length:222 start_codon:yes stop_codon:yes gene_type:complete
VELAFKAVDFFDASDPWNTNVSLNSLEYRDIEHYFEKNGTIRFIIFGDSLMFVLGFSMMMFSQESWKGCSTST